jgi:uncharacterized protein
VNPQTEKLFLTGPAGALQAVRDDPNNAQPQRGVAVIAHPHPLFGGTMDNKVVQTIARAFVQAGWTAVRFNFRGVGTSAGSYDEGRGEADDLRAVIEHTCPAGSALCLAGFSFGSFVVSQTLAWASERNTLEKIIFVGTAASRFAVASIDQALHERTLVIHGEHDDTVPLASVMDWARPQLLPVTVVPAGAHFFHGRLPLLKFLVLRHVCSALPAPSA